jgi:hypothetical protein
MKLLHGLMHLLSLNGAIYENWWIEIPHGKKLMCDVRCIYCGKLEAIQPTGIEIEYEKT